MKNVKPKIAAAATVIGLGGLAGVALSSNSSQGTTSASKPPQPKVRTKVIRRTVHVTRHAKPKEGSGAAAGPSPVSAAPPAAAPVSSAVTGSSSAAPVASSPQVVTQTSGAPAASHPSAPIHTSASGGSGGRGGEMEHEGRGGEHEGGD